MSKKKNKKKKTAADFAKVKLKVGKKLKKATATDTRIDARKVVVLEQLSVPTEACVSHRGRSLEDISHQLGHYNLNVRRGALISLRQVLVENNSVLHRNLRLLVRSVARLIADDKCDSSFRSHLNGVLVLLCTASAESMSSHFPLFMGQTLRALTHANVAVRDFALSVLVMLMQIYPQLARNSADLFDVLLTVLSGQRIPQKRQLCRDALAALLKVYEVVEKDKLEITESVATMNTNTGRCSLVNLTPRVPPFFFPVLSRGLRLQKSPLECEEGVLRMASTLSSLIEKLFHIENRLVPQSVALVEHFERVVTRLRRSEHSDEFESKFAQSLSPLIRISANAKLPRQFRVALRSLQGVSDDDADGTTTVTLAED